MSDLLDETTGSGLSRRDILKRGAVAGGALVWATPVVQSLGGTALAATQGSQTGVPFGFSFVAVLYRCGDALYSVKYNTANSGFTTECPAHIANDTVHDPDGMIGLYEGAATGAANSCGPITATETADGGLTVDLGGCTLVRWLVHKGCFAKKGTAWPGSAYLDSDHPDPLMASVTPLGTTLTFEAVGC